MAFFGANCNLYVFWTIIFRNKHVWRVARKRARHIFQKQYFLEIDLHTTIQTRKAPQMLGLKYSVWDELENPVQCYVSNTWIKFIFALVAIVAAGITFGIAIPLGLFGECWLV